MAVFTAGTVDRKMSKNLKRKDEDGAPDAPLMAAKQRPRDKRSWYRRPQTWVAAGVVLLVAGGISLLFSAHGGDTESAGTKHFVPWGRDSPERIKYGYGELARARARLQRVVDTPAAKPKSLKSVVTAKKQVEAKKKVSSVKSFNKWLDKKHKPVHTLEAALHAYEKKEGYKRERHSLKGGEYKDQDKNFGKKFGSFLAKTHPVGHTLHSAGVHPDTFHPSSTSPSQVCWCVLFIQLCAQLYTARRQERARGRKRERGRGRDGVTENRREHERLREQVRGEASEGRLGGGVGERGKASARAQGITPLFLSCTT